MGSQALLSIWVQPTADPLLPPSVQHLSPVYEPHGVDFAVFVGALSLAFSLILKIDSYLNACLGASILVQASTVPMAA